MAKSVQQKQLVRCVPCHFFNRIIASFRFFEGRLDVGFESLKILNTPPKFNIAPEKLPSQKERIVFQPSIFSGELLNFRDVFSIVFVCVLQPPKWLQATWNSDLFGWFLFLDALKETKKTT